MSLATEHLLFPKIPQGSLEYMRKNFERWWNDTKTRSHLTAISNAKLSLNASPEGKAVKTYYSFDQSFELTEISISKIKTLWIPGYWKLNKRNFRELCNVIKWKEAPHAYNKGNSAKTKSITVRTLPHRLHDIPSLTMYSNVPILVLMVKKKRSIIYYWERVTKNCKNDVSTNLSLSLLLYILQGEYYILSNRLLREEQLFAMAHSTTKLKTFISAIGTYSGT